MMEEKINLHTKNKHRFGYNFDELMISHPALEEFVFTNKYANKTIDFSNQKALLALNKSLLIHFYKLNYWEIPENNLCPPIPGRVDYIHSIADKINSIQTNNITILDIGTGANLIYPILAVAEYNWDVVASETDELSIQNALRIISKNELLSNKVEVRKQSNSSSIFEGIIKQNDSFTASICNPPFHKSMEEANYGSSRKWKNLKIKKQANEVLNFGGVNNELWCEGGEQKFILSMIRESINYKDNCSLFTTLVSKKENVASLINELQKHKAKIEVINQSQGQKSSRILTWKF